MEKLHIEDDHGTVGAICAWPLGTLPPHGAWPMSAECGDPSGVSEWTNQPWFLTFALGEWTPFGHVTTILCHDGM